jgi:carboxyl-terminal processing protease
MARDLMAHIQKGPRSKQLEALKETVSKLEQKEISAVSADLSKLGVDWAAPPADYAGGPDTSKVKIEVTTDRPKDIVRAGEAMTLKVTAKNEGDKPLYQLRAVTKSDAAYYDEKELVFGKLMPGESRTATAPLGFCTIEGRKPGSTEPVPLDAKRVCDMPKDAVMRQDAVKVQFFAEGADAPESAEFRPTVESLDRPTFAYSYQVVDNRDANGNGQLERGEGASVYMRIKNVGTGPSYETQANLRNLTGDGLLLRAGRFDVSRMKPGETRDVTFSFDVLDSFTEPEVKLELSVVDRDLRVVSSEKLVLPVVKKGIALRPGEGAVEMTKAVELRDQPVAGSLVVGRVPQGKLLKRLGTYGDFVKVDLGQTRFAFVEAAATRTAPQAPALTEFDQEPRRSPPVLEVKPASLSTRDAKVHVQGRASDPDGGVLDAFIFVGSRKVFYKSNKGAKDKSSLEFSLDAELTPGVNVITVVARESEDTASRYTMIVRRDGPNGEALPTPKAELFGEDWQFTGDGE